MSLQKIIKRALKQSAGLIDAIADSHTLIALPIPVVPFPETLHAPATADDCDREAVCRTDFTAVTGGSGNEAVFHAAFAAAQESRNYFWWPEPSVPWLRFFQELCHRSECLPLMTLAEGEVVPPIGSNDETRKDITAASTVMGVDDWNILLAEAAAWLGLPLGSIRAEPENRPVIAKLRRRLAGAEEFFINRHGEIGDLIYSRFADDLSRQGFAHFLRSKITAHIFEDKCQTVFVPTPASQAWRDMRRGMPVRKPVLAGASQGHLDFFVLHSFIYEQYGIPGVVEAKPGDTVLDVGAYIGDTAIYFSWKCGPAGRVFGFEMVAESAELARQNLENNGCADNVTIVEKALADKPGTLRYGVAPALASTTAEFTENYQCDRTAEATTIDIFAAERGLRVDFIKIDAERAEMSILKGAEATIRRDKPTCAIALYHLAGDYADIPGKLLELCPEYELYFRCEAEPVIFARIPS